ncbi:Clp protease [Paractinoplanes rishiriensis]|uniref:Clp protease n=1 Tax=Paractinoplanes rishiriensis TaxID=1050105 RepID=A0A919JQ01_9ACTN|nr:Clp protease [Actinoplanes rishiriensis]
MFERFTAAARESVTGAQQAARDLGHPYIGTEHVLIALIADEQSPTARLLATYGVTARSVRAEVQRHVGPAEPDPALEDADADAEDKAALRSIGIDLDAVRAAIEENFGAGALRLPRTPPRKRTWLARLTHRDQPRFRGPTRGHIPFTARAKKVLELSLREALRLRHNYIAPEHILLGLLREGDGLAALILADQQVDFDRLRSELTAALPGKAA